MMALGKYASIINKASTTGKQRGVMLVVTRTGSQRGSLLEGPGLGVLLGPRNPKEEVPWQNRPRRGTECKGNCISFPEML